MLRPWGAMPPCSPRKLEMYIFWCKIEAIDVYLLMVMQGFAELEYGMLRYMGAIDDTTPVVTTGIMDVL